MKYYIDTNIFIYSTNSSDPHHLDCKRILEKIALGKIKALTSVETFQEIVHYSQKNKVLTRALIFCQRFTITDLSIVPFTIEILQSYLALVRKYPSINSRDSLHVATCLANGGKLIVSTDKDFDKIKEIKRIDPKDFTD